VAVVQLLNQDAGVLQSSAGAGRDFCSDYRRFSAVSALQCSRAPIFPRIQARPLPPRCGLFHTPWPVFIPTDWLAQLSKSKTLISRKRRVGIRRTALSLSGSASCIHPQSTSSVFYQANNLFHNRFDYSHVLGFQQTFLESLSKRQD
jgi:hypothetical protein